MHILSLEPDRTENIRIPSIMTTGMPKSPWNVYIKLKLLSKGAYRVVPAVDAAADVGVGSEVILLSRRISP